MPQTQINNEGSVYSGISGAIKKSINNYGFLRWFFTAPVIFAYCVSYALLSPEYKSTYQINYEDLNKKIAIEKSGITTPAPLPSDLFYYSGAWQDMIGENPLVSTLITSSLEHLFKSINFLKDIQDNDEAMLKTMIRDKLIKAGDKKTGPHTEQEIYESIISKGEYFSRLFSQLFSQHGLKKLGAKYSETDVEIFFNMLVRSPYEKKFRRLLGAFVLNAPYYLVIKNSINEYYQNSSILIPVDLFSFTLFMMFLEQIKNRENRPTIGECRSWVFSVIVPDQQKRNELQSGRFSVQQITREEMIMPNPGYFSKGYNKKKHKAIDIASERGTMIRSPITGTVTYYERSPVKSRTGNFIIIKDERSGYNIFICHMDNKDYIEEHSTEGGLAEPIANLTPDWIHPLKKGQFFEVVGSSGKSTGAHTHIQIAQRDRPYTTFDFFEVNKPYQKQFNEYLYMNGYWQVYSSNEQLLLSALGMAVSRYSSTRHFADRDPSTLELYSLLQKNYTPVSVTIDPIDLTLEKIPENILHTYFSKAIQEKVIAERYADQLEYLAGMILHFNHFLKLEVPLAATPLEKAIPRTPWQMVKRRRDGKSADPLTEDPHEVTFYHAVNKYFLYKIMQLNDTPRDIRDRLLSDSMFTGNILSDMDEEFPVYPFRSTDERIKLLGDFIQGIVRVPVDVSFFYDENFCESVFTDIITASRAQGVALNNSFGFFRYHMNELQNSYRNSRFIQFPDTREFKYNSKYDDAIREFFLDIFELAAEHRNSELFRELYRSPDQASASLFRRFSRKISRRFNRISINLSHLIFNTPYPEEPEIPPYHLHSVFQRIIKNIVTPVSYESRTYAEKTLYRSYENSIFYSLIYEVYISERERYMKLFPIEQLTGVIDAIGLFDSMFKVFCDNAAQKQMIEKEHDRITQELEQMEKELDTSRESKRQLQEDFKRKTANLKMLGDYVSRHGELFSAYFTEEEKISKTIAYLEQSLDRYRQECNVLKDEKAQLKMRYEEKLKTMNREIEELKSKSILDQHRFRMEIKNIAYHKEKAEQEIIDLEAEIGHLKKEKENLDRTVSETLQKTDKALSETLEIQKKHEKTILDYNAKFSEQEIIISNLKNDFNRIQKKFYEFVNMIRTSMGPYAKDLTLEELTKEIQSTLKSAETYQAQNSTIRLLQDQQKNDKRSLMLNANLITELRDRVEKLEVQLHYLQNTTPSIREKDLEEENERLSETIRELKASIKKSGNI